ncbi:AAA family ATPase [Amaricoccus solimangrovi]|uniref:AAA family ATPase n=1 Tax=Amaricoccus solimangrovi TaxID=2589815 RepID=UPI0015E29A70|nr:AAA family ATPase [Amaricoccus solimangrovi]
MPRDPVPRLEFFGLPGSGKTTLARACWNLLEREEPPPVFAPRLTHDDWPGARRTPARLGLILRALPGAPTERRAARRIAAIPQHGPRDRAKVVFNALTVAALYRRLRNAPGGYLVDQGLLQAIWSAYLRAPVPFSPESWREILAPGATPGRTYVCVVTPVRTCVRRLDARFERHSRLQSGGLLEDAAVWSRAEAIRAALVETLIAGSSASPAAPPRVILADGTYDPESSAVRILMALRGTPRRSRLRVPA